jgi:hypothetical protein
MSMTLNLLTATHSALGTSQALKSQHGSGYQLTVRLKPVAGIAGGIDPEAAFERVAAVLVYPRLTDHLVLPALLAHCLHCMHTEPSCPYRLG